MIDPASLTHVDPDVVPALLDLQAQIQAIPAGQVGPQGPAGPQGVQGIAGPAGIQGVAGPAGLPGAIGPQGLPGPQGSQGLQGLRGTDGRSIVVTVSATAPANPGPGDIWIQSTVTSIWNGTAWQSLVAAPAPVNAAPVWSTVPTITFTQGVAGSISIAGFVTDPNGDPLTITKNAAALPVGVTYDQANKRFVYDGIGVSGSTGGHVLTADDGKP